MVKTADQKPAIENGAEGDQGPQGDPLVASLDLRLLGGFLKQPPRPQPQPPKPKITAEALNAINSAEPSGRDLARAMMEVDRGISTHLRRNSQDSGKLYKAVATALNQIAEQHGAKPGLTPEFVKEVIRISKEINTAPLQLLSIFSAETGRQFMPKAYESSGGAVGYIQFTVTAIQQMINQGMNFGLKKPEANAVLDKLAAMKPVEQLRIVEKYLKDNLKGNPGTLLNTYLAVFAPAFVGRHPSTPLYTAGGDPAAYSANISLDGNTDRQITADEILKRVNGHAGPLYAAVVKELMKAGILHK